MAASLDALPQDAGPPATDFIRSPVRVFLLGTFAYFGYFFWWLWQLFELAKRDRFPRATTFFAIFIPLYGYVVVFRTFKDLNGRAQSRLVGGFSPLLGVLLLWLSNIFGLAIRIPGPMALIGLLASGLLFATVACSAQGSANRYLRATYPARPAGGVTLGEGIAAAVGLLAFFIIATTSVVLTRALLAPEVGPPGVASSPLAQPSKPAIPYVAPTAPRPPDGFSFTSEPHDYIGQGVSESFSRPSARFLVSSPSADYVTVTVQTDTENWTIQLAAPHGQTLQPGTYAQAERAAFRTGSAPGLDVSGDGRGCNTVFGSFTISQVVFDQRGQLWALRATFVQHCEFADAPALQGAISYGLPAS